MSIIESSEWKFVDTPPQQQYNLTQTRYRYSLVFPLYLKCLALCDAFFSTSTSTPLLRLSITSRISCVLKTNSPFNAIRFPLLRSLHYHGSSRYSVFSFRRSNYVFLRALLSRRELVLPSFVFQFECHKHHKNYSSYTRNVSGSAIASNNTRMEGSDYYLIYQSMGSLCADIVRLPSGCINP